MTSFSSRSLNDLHAQAFYKDKDVCAPGNGHVQQSGSQKEREKQASPAFLDVQILHLVFSLNTPNTASEVRACDQFTSIPNENIEQSLFGRPEFDRAPLGTPRG